MSKNWSWKLEKIDRIKENLTKLLGHDIDRYERVVDIVEHLSLPQLDDFDKMVTVLIEHNRIFS